MQSYPHSIFFLLFFNCVFSPIVVLHYTGDSEVGTGNWCFKDGVITFRDVYDIYIQCFKGKGLSIISD